MIQERTPIIDNTIKLNKFKNLVKSQEELEFDSPRHEDKYASDKIQFRQKNII
jgi:hypothetical protein